MSNQQPQLPPEPKPQQSVAKQWFNRLQLILLFAVFAAPLLGAYYLYSQRDSKVFSTVNNGELYSQPQDLSDLSLLFENDETKTFNSLDKKWYLVVVTEGACDEVCEKNLLKIRQLRRMQGKNINRVVSLFIHSNLDPVIAKDMTEKYSVTSAAATQNDAFVNWLRPFYQARGQQQFDRSRIYVIDPLKKLMMSYPAEVEPKGFYKDLKRLLKVSQIG